MNHIQPSRFARVIPVIDLKAGQVVQAIGGRREFYQPIRSKLTDSTSPAAVAKAISERLEIDELYIADLDAIAGAEPSWDDYRQMAQRSGLLWLDAGVATWQRARQLLEFRAGDRTIDRVILALESIPGPAELEEIVELAGANRLAFSLDLKEGRPWTASQKWSGKSPQQIADIVLRLGIRDLIVLDVACVGMGQGTGTLELCRELRLAHPGVQLLAGGGIVEAAQLYEMARAGCDGALVGSAIHDGRLSLEALRPEH